MKRRESNQGVALQEEVFTVIQHTDREIFHVLH